MTVQTRTEKIEKLVSFARSWKEEFTVRESQLLKAIVTGFSEKGTVPSIAEIRLALKNFSAKEIRLMIKRLIKEGTITVSKEGRITGALGFSSWPTNHTISFSSGPRVNVWCALDAIGLPMALRRDADIVSSCPMCGMKLEATVKNGAVQGYKPKSTVLFMVQNLKSKNVSENICPNINLFCSETHLAAWKNKNPKVHGFKLNGHEASLLAKSFFEELI